jgi:hypothetical protein
LLFWQAIDEINARSDILPNTQLQAHWNDKLTADNATSFSSSYVGQSSGQWITDSRCNETMSMNILMQQIQKYTEIGAIIGPGCSGAAAPVALAAAGLRIPQVKDTNSLRLLA